MYKPVQKKNSSWTPSTVQKKGKSPSKLGHFSIQPKPNSTSAPSQEIGEYSRDSADRLTANVMRGIQAKEQEQAEGLTLQPKFESPWASTFDPPPPLPQSPASKLKGAFAPVSENPIQRQCAECAKEEEEQKGDEKKDLDEIGIQTKLTVGAPGDAYEQEADRVASQVISMSAPPDSSASVQRQLDTNHPHHPHQIWQRAQSIKPVMQRQIDPRVQMRQMIQRAAQIDGNQASGDLESRLNASKGGGTPLSEDVRGFMEPRFGADFSSVRVHTGGEAVQMNQELGAQAFTHGSDVYFGAGKEPGNNELMAHELTHVVQQTGAVQQKEIIQRFDDSEMALRELNNYCLVPERTLEAVTNLSDEAIRRLSDYALEESYRNLEFLQQRAPTSIEVRESLFTIRSEIARRGINRASDDATHQAEVAELVEFTRQQLDVYPAQTQRFIQQTIPNTEEKVRILGEVAVAVARMEFLLGTIYHQGESWESPSNRGYMVDHYTGRSGNQKGYAWCSRFATTVLAMVTGRESLRARSGYKIANPGGFGIDLNYDEDAGGAFTGTHNSRNASTNSSSGNYNVWASLRQTLAQINNGTITDKTSEEAIEEFFTNNTRPQPGDIMVVRSGEGTPQRNSFTRDNPDTPEREKAFKSHTTMIESLDGYVLHTIEGNSGQRVRGKTYNLTDPADVEEIIFIARPSLTSFTTSQNNAQSSDASESDETVITQDSLLQPIRHINQLLENIASEQGYIQNIPEGQNDTVASLVSQNNASNSTE